LDFLRVHQNFNLEGKAVICYQENSRVFWQFAVHDPDGPVAVNPGFGNWVVQ